MMLAMFLLFASVAVPAPASAALPVQGGGCQVIDHTATLSCSISCGIGSALSAAVKATDAMAETSVGVGCGGAGGAMSCPTSACAIAAGPASSDGLGGCSAAVDGLVTMGGALVCVATAGPLACLPVACDDAGPVCAEQHPWLDRLDASVQEALFPPQHLEVVAMSSVVMVEPDLAVAALFERGACAMATYQRSSDGTYEPLDPVRFVGLLDEGRTEGTP